MSLGWFSNTTGVVIRHVIYPNNNRAHAYMAKIVPAYAGTNLTQGVASSPVQLTVSKSTRLPLNVSRDASSSNHTIQGWLKWNTAAVNGKTVKVMVNETRYMPQTDNNGYFSLSLNLQPVNNQATTYMITASFEGDQPLNSTAWTQTLDGQRFAACTTIQNGYKPATNMTTLTVEPQATEAAQQTKTPEQMQQEAEQDGWFTVWHEFSWWYPWYRLHIKLHVNPTVDIGFNPILPGGETYSWENLDAFGAILSEVVQDVAVDVVGLFVAYLVAKATSVWNPAVGGIAEVAKFFLQIGLLVAFNWNSKMELLVAAVVSIIMGFIALSANLGKMFLYALYEWTSSAASAALSALHWKLLDVLFVASFTARWWLDILEATFDWVVAGTALVRYFTMG
jgi:hypothetical protein